jgi:predicted dehydrogenase
MNNLTIFQFFHWYYSAEGNLWNHAAEEASFLAHLGVTHIWLPPAYKSARGVDEACSVLFHYKNGSHATIESSLVSSLDIPAEIVGEKGIIKILNSWYEKASGIELQLNGEGKIIYPCDWEGHGLYFEADEVIRCIENNSIASELMPHEFSLNMIRILDNIRNQINITYEMYE